MSLRSPSLLLVAFLSVGCGAPAPEPAPVPEAPADVFLARLGALCGQAFAGQITANEPATPNDPFVGQPLVMHVRECTADTVRIPFHVGEDRSRTWVITRTSAGLRLKHDHRHADGTSDVLTMYGGDTADPGTASRQAFPVDAESRTLFESQNLQVSLTNTWAVEVEPGQRFVYELSRPGRLFRVEFDLTTAVDAPPPPWGAGSGG
ncbi:MAG TPA: hypothetical protein VMM93_11070 [Vicinamibacterales bacterium]|nr:hypothetical protein [Vicinamibacterales bacterium]